MIGAIIGSSLIGAASVVSSSKAQKKAAKKGMAAEEKMSDKNLEFQKEMAEQQRSDFAPWRESGQNALTKINAGIESGEFDPGAFSPEKFDPSKVDLTQDPGYQFRMQEGIDALDASASARGRLLSGAQNKALTQYGQNMGSQEYGNAYARYADQYGKDYARYADQYAQEADRKARKFNMLSGISQGGQSSAAGQAQASSQLAQTGGNIMANSGRSQNIMNQNIGNARAGAYQGGAQVVNQAAQNWLGYKMNTPSAVAPSTNNIGIT